MQCLAGPEKKGEEIRGVEHTDERQKIEEKLACLVLKCCIKVKKNTHTDDSQTH